MRTARHIVSALFAVALMIASLLLEPSPAQAASDYDDILDTTTSLVVYTNTAKTQTMDVTSTWWSEYKESYALRVAQNIGWPTNFVDDFEEVLANGSWVVYTTTGPYGNVIGFAGTDDPNATCEFVSYPYGRYYVCTTAPGYGVWQADYFTHNSYGGNGCFAGCTTSGMNIYMTPAVTPASSNVNRIYLDSDNYTYDIKILASTFDNEYPVGYEGAILPTTNHASTAEYVAMGDSYSSGEGNSPYDTLTDINGVNECHRSLGGSYSYVISHDNDLGLENIAFVACSGATTDTLLNGGSGSGTWGEGPQVNALSDATQVVTLTIGGNDLGFVEVLSQCSNQAGGLNGWGCSSDATLSNSLENRLEALDGTSLGTVSGPSGDEIHSIAEVIEEIATKAPNAAIYIAGYPHLFGSTPQNYQVNEDAPGDAICVGLGVNFSYDDTQWMNGWADSINAVISDAVEDAQGAGINVTYVSPGAFSGHGLCDNNTPYLYDVLLDSLYPDPIIVNPGSFHPNATGASLAYGVIFQYMMS